MVNNSKSVVWVMTRLLTQIVLLFLLTKGLAYAEVPPGASNENAIQMMKEFDQVNSQKSDGVTPIADKRRHQIMFYLGIPLVIMLLTTAGMGIGIGVYGKPWFKYHIVLAGLTATLAIIHMIVGWAWFYPF
jgi:hypothetical protein